MNLLISKTGIILLPTLFVFTTRNKCFYVQVQKIVL
jgi:hypothetical protein